MRFALLCKDGSIIWSNQMPIAGDKNLIACLTYEQVLRYVLSGYKQEEELKRKILAELNRQTVDTD